MLKLRVGNRGGNEGGGEAERVVVWDRGRIWLVKVKTIEVEHEGIEESEMKWGEHWEKEWGCEDWEREGGGRVDKHLRGSLGRAEMGNGAGGRILGWGKWQRNLHCAICTQIWVLWFSGHSTDCSSSYIFFKNECNVMHFVTTLVPSYAKLSSNLKMKFLIQFLIYEIK